MTVEDLDSATTLPVSVQTCATLSEDDDDWTTLPWAIARKLRLLAAPAFGSADIDLHWGDIVYPEDPDADPVTTTLDVDDLVRLVRDGTVIFHGYVDSIDESDPNIAKAKVNDLGALLARTYLTRGWETDDAGTGLIDPGFLPAYNAIPGGDRSDVPDSDGDGYVHDRTGSSFSSWTAHNIIDSLLRRGMKANLLGAPSGVTAIPWRLDSASAGDYTPDTQDLHGQTVAAGTERLVNARRGLTWRITVASGYAQVLIIDLDAAGTDLDTTADLGWRNARLQRRRDGYDYVAVTGSRPLVGITLSWTRGEDTGALEPDGWDPDTADAALDQALLDGLAGAAYTNPAWRRFRVRFDWPSTQYLSTTAGLRSDLEDGTGQTPLDGGRVWQSPGPPPSALEIERTLPSGAGFTDSPTGPRQSPLVIAGTSGSWQDLSQQCRPTPYGIAGAADRSDQGYAVIVLGESAEDAAALREAVGADGTLLVSIGVREWAPLQCVWTALSADWSPLSPRVYHLRQPGIEEWILLAGTVIGIDEDGLIIQQGTDQTIRSDIAKLKTIRDQLRVRFGNVVTACTITREALDFTWTPGKKLGEITLVDGRAFDVGMPCTSIEYDLTDETTALRWSPILDEKPKA
jgi:hypothetical protein